MAAFDSHEKCARCPGKKVGQDPCVKVKVCNICEGFSDVQRNTLATPSYKIHKENETSILVSSKDITIIGGIDLEEQVSP